MRSVKGLLTPVGLPLVLLVALLVIFAWLLVIALPAYDLAVTVGDNLLDAGIRLAGTVMIGFVALKFATIYTARPSRTRLLVLMAFAMFFAAFLADFLVALVVHVDPVFRNFSIDLALILIGVTLYYMACFGIEVLIAPGSRVASARVEAVLLVLQAAGIASYAIQVVMAVPRHAVIDGIFRDIAMAASYLLAFICLVLLVLMSITSFRLSRKAETPVQRRGLVSLGIAFILVIASLVLIVSIPLVDDAVNLGDVEESILNITALALLVGGIYFIFNGFVKPASLRNEPPA